MGRGGPEVVQRWYIGAGAVVVQRLCSGGANVQRLCRCRCRGGAEGLGRGGPEVVHRCRSSGGAEVQVQRWCSKVVKRW